MLLDDCFCVPQVGGIILSLQQLLEVGPMIPPILTGKESETQRPNMLPRLSKLLSGQGGDSTQASELPF